METIHRSWPLVLASTFLGGLVSVASGCHVLLGADDFSFDAGDAGEAGATLEGGVDDPSKASDLRLTMRDMGVHFNQMIEFRIIDNQNTIQTRGIVFPVDDFGRQSITVNVPGGLPLGNRPYRLDFFGDLNRSGAYDGIGDVLRQDHAWRISPLEDSPAGAFPHVSNVVQVVFEHNKIITDIDQWPPGTRAPAVASGLDARITFSASSLRPYLGKLMQVRLVESRSLHTVGVYRYPQLPAVDFTIAIAGMLEAEVSYNIDVFIDANGNNTYEDPSRAASNADLGWRIPVRATFPDGGAGDAGVQSLVGIDYAFDPAGPNPSNIDVGEF